MASAGLAPDSSNLSAGVSSSEKPGLVEAGIKDSTQEHIEVLSLPVSAADGKVKRPFARPLDSVKPPARPALTSEQEQKYKDLLEKASSWTQIADAPNQQASKNPITDDERMFLTQECLLRYLRATRWNVADAQKRLLDTLSWRREYGVDKLTADYISIENETGKQVVTGYDIHARPCHYLLPSRQNTERSARQIQHLVFMLERVIDLMMPGQEALALLVNMADTKSGQHASVAQGRQTLYILQNHYPERLGRALVSNVPFVLWGFFKLITPFIDPLTREKLKFNEDMSLHVPREQLLKENGGNVDFEYDHAEYWPAFIKLAQEKRTAYKRRWEKAGRHVGESEDYLRGGEQGSLFEQGDEPIATSGNIVAAGSDKKDDETNAA